MKEEDESSPRSAEARTLNEADFNAIRHELPFVLEACRDPSEWFSATGISEFVYEVMTYLESNQDILALTKEEASHLYAIGMLCCIVDEYDMAFEVICKIEECCGGRNGLEFLSEEVILGRPGN
jgi:hypothetical protein